MTPFIPTDFWDFCDALLAEDLSDYKRKHSDYKDAILRSVVNRAYIVAYNSAKWWLQGNNYTYDIDKGNYKQVEMDLKDERKADGAALRDKLKQLRIARLQADYCYCDRITFDSLNVTYFLNISKYLVKRIYHETQLKMPGYCDICLRA